MATQHKKIDKDGNIVYYYYKKKRGRPKKRGPKKKPKKRGRRWQMKWDFKIIQTYMRKQTDYIGIFHNLSEVEKAKKILNERNNQINFPKLYINSYSRDKKLCESKYEYIILKKIRSESETNESRVRNEYGKLVIHKTTSDKWYIYEKMPCLVEETFWVYGYSPVTERKDYLWIDNLVKEASLQPYSLVNIYAYNNKLIIRYDGGEFDFVICKNTSDSIRLYNKLRKDNLKNKRIVFTGKCEPFSDRTRDVIKMIAEKTGWTLNKIYRKTTRK